MPFAAMPIAAAWILLACAACASVPPAPKAAPAPKASPPAPAPATPAAPTPTPAQTSPEPPPAKSAPAAKGDAAQARGGDAPRSADEGSSGGPPGRAPTPGADPGAGAILVPAGATPDDMPPAAPQESRPPAGQGGGAASAPSPPGRNSAPGLTLSIVVPPQTVQGTNSVTVEIAAASTAGVVDAPLHLAYDPAQLRFLEASEGDFMNRDGGGTVFLVNGHSRPGDVVIGIGRSDRSRGALGRGTLCRVRFEVLAPGTARLTIGPAMAWAVDGSLVPVTTNAAEIRITGQAP